MKKRFLVTVSYPVYVTVEADDIEQAEEFAIEEAEHMFDVSSIDPIIHEIYTVDE